MGGTGRPLGKTFFLQCQRRHPELPKIPTYLPRGSPPLRSGGGGIRSGPHVCLLPSRGSPPLQSGGGGGGIRSGPQTGKVATSPLPYRGSPPLLSRQENQKWPTSGQTGYVIPAVSGIPTTAERGGNQKWPTYRQSAYVTPAVPGIPTSSEPRGKSEVTHQWAKWLRHPCRLGDPHCFRVGGGIRSRPLIGEVATSPLLSRNPHSLRSGGKIGSGPQVGKVARSPLPSRRSPPLRSAGGISIVAHIRAKWLRHPCHLGDPHSFRAGRGEIRSGPQVGKVATSPLLSQGSPTLQSGGEIRSGSFVHEVAT